MISFLRRRFLENRKDPNTPRIIYYTISKLQILKRWSKKDFTRILDVGCGNGIFIHRFENEYANIIGVDVNLAALKKGKKHVKSDLICASADCLPFRENQFDLVLAVNLLHHADNPIEVLGEMRRVASQNLYIIEPNRLNPVLSMYTAINETERAALFNSKNTFESYFRRFQFKILKFLVGGTITPNLTPSILVGFLKWVNLRSFKFGFYLHYLLEKSQT